MAKCATAALFRNPVIARLLGALLVTRGQEARRLLAERREILEELEDWTKVQ